MANTGRVSSVQASMLPLAARNMTIDMINESTHTSAPTRTTRWLSSSLNRSSRFVWRASHSPVLDDSNFRHTPMTWLRLSALSSSRS